MGFFSRLLGKYNNEVAKQIKEKVSFVVNNVKENSVVVESSDIPPLQGDYAKTIFLYATRKAFPVKNKNEYVGYLLYECGIKDASQYHRTLISEGYYEKSSNQQLLKSLTLTTLKAMLLQLGLTVSGKKDVLIERILENADDAFIRRYCPEDMYSLSDKGIAFLDEHNDYVKIHKHKNWLIDWKEFDAHKKPGYNFFDVVWEILNARLPNARIFGRTEYLCMYELLEEEGRRKEALEMLLRVIYIDFCGTELLDFIRLYKSGIYTVQTIKEYFSVAIMIAPGLINAIPKYADIYEDSMVDKLYEWKLPVRVCSKELFLEIMHSIYNGNYDTTITEEKLRKAYNKKIKKLI